MDIYMDIQQKLKNLEEEGCQEEQRMLDRNLSKKPRQEKIGEGMAMVKFYTPTYNLGCFGVKFSNMVYFDLYRNPVWGMFLRIGEKKWTITRLGIVRWQ